MAKKFQHEWSFMANPGSNGKGELAYCALCKHWRYDDGEPFKMSQERFESMHEAGEVNASEVLGVRKTVHA